LKQGAMVMLVTVGFLDGTSIIQADLPEHAGMAHTTIGPIALLTNRMVFS
jgi:hypothetical protein